jgi:hypothetical protein
MARTASANDLLDDAADVVFDAIADAGEEIASQVSAAAGGKWDVAGRRPGRRGGALVLLVLVAALIGWRWSRA